MADQTRQDYKSTLWLAVAEWPKDGSFIPEVCQDWAEVETLRQQVSAGGAKLHVMPLERALAANDLAALCERFVDRYETLQETQGATVKLAGPDYTVGHWLGARMASLVVDAQRLLGKLKGR